MINRPPRHRGPADRWRAAQERAEDHLPPGFTRAETLMSDAFNRVTHPTDKVIPEEIPMSKNTASNNNADASNENPTADKQDTGKSRTRRAMDATREAVKPSNLARFGKAFGKVAGAVAVTGLAIYGGVAAYKRYVPAGAIG